MPLTRTAPAIRIAVMAVMSALPLLAIPVHADVPNLLSAIEAGDVVKLEKISQAEPRTDEARLAGATVRAFRHDDDAALRALKLSATGKADHELRAAAYIELSAVYLRRGEFKLAYEALTAAQPLRAAPFDDSLNQDLGFTKALRSVAAMQLTHAESGVLAITRDTAGLVRVGVQIDQQQQDVVVDTGAGFSTMTQSTADRLGLKMLSDTVSVSSGSQASVKSRLGVAPELRFGKAILKDVVFIVVPDSDLTFGDGAYKIDAIVGLPVFLKLGRLEFINAEGHESLEYGPKKDEATPHPNMILRGVSPLVLVDADKASTPLRMFIDTGATTTMLNPSALADFPQLATGAESSHVRLGGAGGTKDDNAAQRLPELRLKLDGQAIVLKDVQVLSDSSDTDRHGAIGQDILRHGKTFVLDFDHMHFGVGG